MSTICSKVSAVFFSFVTHTVNLTFCLQDYTEFARDLESAPEGYESCHGVKNRPDVNLTQFEEDEFVIYSVSQQQIRYLVEFSLPGDDVGVNDVDDAISSSEGVSVYSVFMFSLGYRLCTDRGTYIPIFYWSNVTTRGNLN